MPQSLSGSGVERYADLWSAFANTSSRQVKLLLRPYLPWREFTQITMDDISDSRRRKQLRHKQRRIGMRAFR